MRMIDKTFFKTMVAGIFGTGSSFGSWIYSEQCSVFLGNVIKIIGILAGIISMLYMWKINRRRSHIKAIDEAFSEGKLCHVCRIGQEPEFCPIELSHRPADCPKVIRLEQKQKRLTLWRKLNGLLFTGDTTKT